MHVLWSNFWSMLQFLPLEWDIIEKFSIIELERHEKICIYSTELTNFFQMWCPGLKLVLKLGVQLLFRSAKHRLCCCTLFRLEFPVRTVVFRM